MPRTKEQHTIYMREYRKKKTMPPLVIPPVIPPVTLPVTPPVTPSVTLIRTFERKRCLNCEFLDRSAFPVHKYTSRHVMVDIRDHYSPSLDKACSYPAI